MHRRARKQSLLVAPHESDRALPERLLPWRGKWAGPGEQPPLPLHQIKTEPMSDCMPRMLPSQFKIGDAFTNGSVLFRCTDVGSRVVIGIPIDRAEIVEVRNGVERPRMVDLREEPSWLIGPPYGVSEIVFDEFDLDTVRLVPEVEVANWRASETL